MTPALPKAATYLIVGGGVHGLSTAWHLTMELDKSGAGSGADVVFLEGLAAAPLASPTTSTRSTSSNAGYSSRKGCFRSWAMCVTSAASSA